MKACDRYLNAIHELVDGTLGPIRRAELELHLENCEGCRALAQDLQAIGRTARSLDRLQPPDRVWRNVAGRLRTEGRATAARTPLVQRRSMVVFALAAALVLLVGSSLVMLRRQAQAPEPATAPQAQAGGTAPAATSADDGNAAQAAPVQSVAEELALTERHFQNVVEQASAADPQTAAVLQKQLMVMNNAIAESRKALESDPQSGSTQFYQMLKQKIRFLQDTIALMNEMRQGDAAGAAQIVEGGKS